VDHLRASGIATDVFAHNVDVGHALVDGCTLRQSDLADLVASGAVVETVEQAVADAAIAAKCGTEASLGSCRFKSDVYSDAQMHNALRQLHAEYRVGQHIQAHASAYDVAIVAGPDFYFAANVSAADVRAAARPDHARVVFTSDTNDGLRGTGITDGFYIGQPSALLPVLSRFVELPGLVAQARRPDDYEHALQRTFDKHSVVRKISPTLWFKVRADSRFVYQGSVVRWWKQPAATRAALKRRMGMSLAKPTPWAGLPAWFESAPSSAQEQMFANIKHLANWSTPACHHDDSAKKEVLSWGLCGVLNEGLLRPRACTYREAAVGPHSARTAQPA